MYTNSHIQLGGFGGGTFNDSPFSSGIVGISRILVRSGVRIDKLTVVYRLAGGGHLTREHGGNGGGDNPEIVLASDEKICGVVVRCGSGIDSLMFITYRGGDMKTVHKYGPFGGGGGSQHVVVSPNIVSFFGYSGAELDNIGFWCEDTVVET